MYLQVSAATIQAQLDVLNDACELFFDITKYSFYYIFNLFLFDFLLIDAGKTAPNAANSFITFKTKEIRYIQNANYLSNCGAEPYRGENVRDAGIVNVFTCPDPSYLGWAYLPWSFSEGSARSFITIHPGTMPGGSLKNLNLGDTLVHEMGHHFGLLHTFSTSGSCNPAAGDKVRIVSLNTKFESFH